MLINVLAAAVAWPTTPTAYPHYPGRTVYTLSGSWDFAFSPSYNASVTTSLDGLAFDSSATVPGAWDASNGTGLRWRRGVGVYRTRASVPAGRPAALHFAACSLFCRVYVDGELLHNHTLGGFTPFWVAVPTAKAAEREVTVLTSNNFSPELTPTQYAYYDFYQYGGLLRPVALHVLPARGPSLERVEVDDLSPGDGAKRPSPSH